MLKTLLEQGVEGGVPSSTVERRNGARVVQGVRLWAANVVVVVVTALQLGGSERQGN